jgi:DNA primase
MNRLEIVKEQIRQQVSLTQLIERLTGQRFSKGKILCPFHTEKTPSFIVTESKGVYYCQGCGAGGDIFSFASRHQGLDFTDAIRFIDNEFELGLMDGNISVAAQVAVRKANEQRALEVKAARQANERYERLCALYRVNNLAVKKLEPMSDTWGQCIWRLEWLEYAMEEELKQLK